AEGDERDSRIALDDRSEVLRLRQSSSEQGDDEESAQQDRRTEDVEPEAVDGMRVPGGFGRVADERQRDHDSDAEDSGDGDGDVRARAEAQRRHDRDEDDGEDRKSVV